MGFIIFCRNVSNLISIGLMGVIYGWRACSHGPEVSMVLDMWQLALLVESGYNCMIFVGEKVIASVHLYKKLQYVLCWANLLPLYNKRWYGCFLGKDTLGLLHQYFQL